MKKILLLLALLVMIPVSMKAEVDPNFYIYLCFGQSNMEGNATPEAQDKDNVDPRFQMLACVDFNNPKRTMGEWYTAVPPIVREGTGLGMADYFGRTMVKNLPENVRVGVVDVALGGTKIEGFISEEVADYIKDEADWLKGYFAAYDNDPYKRLVDMAKIAQQSGVIKGILLHQGESNNGQSDWPDKVKLIYDRLMDDLGLNPEEIPLFVGETVSQAQGGACWLHNSVIAKMPSVIANSYVISSADCPQKGDGLHFTASGYRVMGQRYAKAALHLIGIEAEIDEPTPPATAFELDQPFTNLDEIGDTPFIIYNEAAQRAFFGSDNQNLGYDVLSVALQVTNAVIGFRLEPCDGYYLLRGITPVEEEYNIWGNPGYLNSQPVDGWCSFILGLNYQNGQDIENGALWDIEYVAGQGFSLKNVGTGKYLQDAMPAKYDDPMYFSFYSYKEASSGIKEVRRDVRPADAYVYALDGRRVDPRSLRPGIYIQNGRKFIVH